MSVNIRTKKISGGRLSLYLDFYPPIRKEDGSETRREFLKRYLYENPKNENEKKINKENELFAETVRLAREKEILNNQDGIFNVDNRKKDFLKFFESLCEKRYESKGNYGNWLSSLKYLRAFTNDKCKMKDLTTDFCDDFKLFLLSTDKLNTTNNLKLAHNSALSYFNKFCCAVEEAYKRRFIIENPIEFVDKIKQRETKIEFVTEEELQTLANTDCEIPILKKAALFSALTGLRWSDIENLIWNDVRESDGVYRIYIRQEKTEDTVFNPINKTAYTLLGERKSSNEKVFNGLKYSDSNNDKLKRWILSAGITKKITFHCFRHTFAVILLNKGVDIYTVSKMLGHKSIQTTLRYVKLLDSTKVSAANAIDINL